MNQLVKKNIDFIVPVAAAAGCFYLINRKTEDPKKAAIYSIIIFVLLYLVTSKITKSIVQAGLVPAAVTQYPGGVTNYDPKADGEALRKDLYCFACMRNKDLYYKLIGYSDYQLTALWNYWREQYFGINQETLTQAIDDEMTYGMILDEQVRGLVKRMQSIGLN